MRKFMAMVLALAMVISMLPAAAFAADSDFVIENGVLTKYTGPGGDVVIPDGVTSIGSAAFQYCRSLTSVVIPDSVVKIDDSVFEGCTSMKNVTIPNSVIGIGQSAFAGCTGLTSVTIHYNSAAPGAPAPTPAPGIKIELSAQNLTVDAKENVACEKYNIDGNNYFKLRDLAALLNGTGSQFEVGYDDATKTAIVNSVKK